LQNTFTTICDDEIDLTQDGKYAFDTGSLLKYNFRGQTGMIVKYFRSKWNRIINRFTILLHAAKV
jgi:hypothetical protein